MHFGFSCSTTLTMLAMSREKSGSLGTTRRNGEWHIKSGSEITEGLLNKNGRSIHKTFEGISDELPLMTSAALTEASNSYMVKVGGQSTILSPGSSTHLHLHH
jgi:hypothetical protein